MKRLKVLHIITRLIVGGAQENTLYTAELLNDKNFDVHVLSGLQTGSEGSLIENAKLREIKLHFDPFLVREISPLKDILSLIRMVRYIRSGGYDIVHTHSSKAGIIGRLAAKMAGVPIIIHTVHGWGFHDYQHRSIRWFYIALERSIAKITNCLIAVTKKDIEKGVHEKIGTHNQYSLIRSGIALNDFRNSGVRRELIRESLKIPHDAKIIGTVTRLSLQKSPLTFVKAASIALKKHPDCFFIVVGDGPMRQSVESLAKELKIHSRVVLTGIRNDVPDLMNCFDIFVLTSLWEGLPRVLPQAMASGVPIVASRVDGSAEIVEDNFNGILAKPASEEDFSKKIVTLIEDPEFCRKLSKNGSMTANEYCVHKMVTDIEGLYLKASIIAKITSCQE
jgi:glycosyltransferase involved in cell wall biosynthesis